MENVPAYKRRNVELDDVNPSSEAEVSKYTLWESEDDNGEKKTAKIWRMLIQRQARTNVCEPGC